MSHKIFTPYTTKTNYQIFQEFGVSPLFGLSSKESSERLKKFGQNTLHAKETKLIHIILRQFSSPFVYLLLGASLITLILGEYIDSAMILFFVLLNASLGFFQEYKSENTFKLLKQYIVSRAQVLRDGKETFIDSKEVVPGDILILEEGDIVCADARIFKSINFIVDESILTGESIPIKKKEHELAKASEEIFQAENIAFSGTTVVNGRALGVVIAAGTKSILGNIHTMVQESFRASAFEKGISKFSSLILKIIIATLLFVFIVNLLIKGKHANIAELIVFSLSLAVSVIPEALPLVTTFSLSRGAHRLAKNKVVIKRLSAIEDLGGIEILCTDKTGTLTENILTLDEIYAHDKFQTLLYGALAVSSLDSQKKEPNNAFDLALWKNLSRQQKTELYSYKRLEEMPFDPDTRENAILVEKNGITTYIARGAPEVVMKQCALTQSEIHKLNRCIAESGKTGRRIIAIASNSIPKIKNTSLAINKKNLQFHGLITFIDPIKKSAKSAVEKAKKLGITIKILTGDSPEVAGFVAQELKLIASTSEVITGEAFDAMSVQKKHTAIEKFAIFARCSPEQKYKIIQLLKEKKSVGFLGEGINDAPALKISDVGIVVHDASDIAREAADIIILKKSLEVVVNGIKEGREVFANTLKYIKATLASNFGNFYAVAIASLMVNYLPILPLQILLINLLSDFPMIAIATDNIDTDDIKGPQNYNLKHIITLATILGLISTVFDFIFFAIFSRISSGVLQTNWFIGSILTELVFLFSIRTKKFFLKAKRPSNLLLYLTIFAFFSTLAIPFTQFGRNVFKFLAPKPAYIFLILLIVGIYFAVTETVKLVYYASSNQQKTKNK